jgi:hypothetical protein
LSEGQEVLLVEESVQGSVAVTLGPHETRNSEGRGFPGVDSLLVNLGKIVENRDISIAYLSNGDLNGSMILGVKDSVGGRALSRDIEINELSLIVLNDSIIEDIQSN